jgi:hypothetical protein
VCACMHDVSVTCGSGRHGQGWACCLRRWAHWCVNTLTLRHSASDSMGLGPDWVRSTCTESMVPRSVPQPIPSQSVPARVDTMALLSILCCVTVFTRQQFCEWNAVGEVLARVVVGGGGCSWCNQPR